MFNDRAPTARNGAGALFRATITPPTAANASQRPTAAHRGPHAAIHAATAYFYENSENRQRKNAAPHCRYCGEILAPAEVVLDEKGVICETCFNSLCLQD